MAHLTRRRVVSTALATAAAGAFIPAQAAAAAPARPARPRPLAPAHAHNDYLHPRPLHDALAHGFTSVEADVFLVDGELLVAHEESSLDPARTLTALYLDPLHALVRANHGSVHAGHRAPLQLLIDIKNDGAAAYLALDRLLRSHRHIMTRCSHGRIRTGAVTPVISGDRAARVPMEAQTTRYAFYDGRPDDLGTAAPASSSRSSARTGPRASAGRAPARSPPPNGPGCAATSTPPTRRGNASASGPRPTRRVPPATPCGTSCLPRVSTTSTRMTWQDSQHSSAAAAAPAPDTTAGPSPCVITRAADTPVRRTASPLRHTGGRKPPFRRGGGGWPWPFRSHWCSSC